MSSTISRVRPAGFWPFPAKMVKSPQIRRLLWRRVFFCCNSRPLRVRRQTMPELLQDSIRNSAELALL